MFCSVGRTGFLVFIVLSSMCIPYGVNFNFFLLYGAAICMPRDRYRIYYMHAPSGAHGQLKNYSCTPVVPPKNGRTTFDQFFPNLGKNGRYIERSRKIGRYARMLDFISWALGPNWRRNVWNLWCPSWTKWRRKFRHKWRQLILNLTYSYVCTYPCFVFMSFGSVFFIFLYKFVDKFNPVLIAT